MSIFIKLKNNFDKLKLNTMYERLEFHLNSLAVDNDKLLNILLDLTDFEIAFKDKRAELINIHISNFPYVKTIDDFDFSFQPSINKNQIMDLLTLRFLDNFDNILFQGLSGTGKTHLSVAIGMAAASKRISTYFITCHDLIQNLKKALAENRLAEKIKVYNKYKLLIIDEIGFLPIKKEDASLLFQLISKRYETKSTIITTNIPFSKWGELFGDNAIASAILDRLVHHSHIIQIEGPSYRMKDML